MRHPCDLRGDGARDEISRSNCLSFNSNISEKFPPGGGGVYCDLSYR